MRFKKGFTLLELLVVIGIIGILSTIILASLSTAKARGRDARRVGDIKQLQQAVENYFEDNSSYPATASWPGSISTYLAGTPTDPSTGMTYGYSGGGSSYCIGTNFEKGAPANIGPSSSCTVSGYTYTVGNQ